VLDAVDEHAVQDAELGRGQPDPERVVHERAHARDLLAQASSKTSTGRACALQHRIAEDAHVRERGVAPRGDLRVEGGGSCASGASATSTSWTSCSAIALEGSYCGSTSTLNAAARWARSAATACTAAPTCATAAARSCALTTTWARSRPRRRKSGAGPEASARRSRTRGRRRQRRARASRRADDADQRRERRVAQRAAALELAGQEAVGVVAAAKRIDGASGASVCTSTPPGGRRARRGPRAG
jgi:hypothetical protein